MSSDDWEIRLVTDGAPKIYYLTDNKGRVGEMSSYNLVRVDTPEFDWASLTDRDKAVAIALMELAIGKLKGEL